MNTPQPSDESTEKNTDQKKPKALRTAGYVLLGAMVIVPALLIYVGKQLVSQENRKKAQERDEAARARTSTRITLDTGERRSNTAEQAVPQVKEDDKEDEEDKKESEAPEEIAQEPVYVASDDSDRFHTPTCRWAGNINPGNRVEFEDRETALDEGYTPCGTCRP